MFGRATGSCPIQACQSDRHTPVAPTAKTAPASGRPDRAPPAPWESPRSRSTRLPSPVDHQREMLVGPHDHSLPPSCGRRLPTLVGWRPRPACAQGWDLRHPSDCLTAFVSFGRCERLLLARLLALDLRRSRWAIRTQLRPPPRPPRGSPLAARVLTLLGARLRQHRRRRRACTTVLMQGSSSTPASRCGSRPTVRTSARTAG
jgi:hypothetical protein